MPEGPEIFLTARAVHAAVAQQPCTLELCHPILAAKAHSLRGVQIARVPARSKAMLTEFVNGVVLYSHNQLYGEWVVHPVGAPFQRSVRRGGVLRPWVQYQAVRAAGADFEAARFYAFDREGAPCWNCGTPIERVLQGGRGLFFCPACQSR